MSSPRTLATALRQPRYLISVWPWRSLAYLGTTAPIASLLACGLLIVALPTLRIVSVSVALGHPPTPFWTAAFVAAFVVFVTIFPLVSFAVAAVERARLVIVDSRRLPQPRWRGFAARYTSIEAWREAAHMLWLGTIVPAVYWGLMLLIALDFTMISSLWLTREADGIILIWSTVDTPGQALPFAIAGVLFLPVLGYLVGLVAFLQSTMAQWLLSPRRDSAALQEVNRSRTRLVDAYETERRRIERDVHDAAQPRLTSLTLQLGLAKLDVPDDSPAARPLSVAIEQAKGLMVLLRQIVQGIRPQSLIDLGLAGAVRELAREATVPVTVTADLPHPVGELVETTAWYVVSEALGNVSRHAAATRAAVGLSQVDGVLIVEVSDDGRGGADPTRGTGLTGLADRVAAVNGLLLLSSPAGGPTLVRVEIPWRT